MKILFIGKFEKLHDEEYIARSFEMLDIDIKRIDINLDPTLIHYHILKWKPNIVLFTKYIMPELVKRAVQQGREEWKLKTVCWLFDLYWGYVREYRIKNDNYFRADYVFTTDGGDHPWKDAKVNHQVVRQGIYKEHCHILERDKEWDVIFIGSESPVYHERNQIMINLSKRYNFKWFGRYDTNEIRGEDLNKVIARAKIVIGDSYPSPNYWSNRIVETLGRGGFMIHKTTEGLKEEYPDLVQYVDYNDLCTRIDYYLEHEDERLDIIKKNFELVKSKYTMDKKCAELINYVKI